MPRMTVYQCGSCRRTFADWGACLDHITGEPDRPPPPCYTAGLFAYRNHEEGMPFPEDARCEACGRQAMQGMAHCCGVITREHRRAARTIECGPEPETCFVLGSRVSPSLPPPIARLHYQCSVCGALFALQTEALHHTSDSRPCLHAEIRTFDPRSLASRGFERMHRETLIREFGFATLEGAGEPPSSSGTYVVHSRGDVMGADGAVVRAEDWNGPYTSSPPEAAATWSNVPDTAPSLSLADLQRAMDRLGDTAGSAASAARDLDNAMTEFYTRDTIAGIAREEIDDAIGNVERAANLTEGLSAQDRATLLDYLNGWAARERARRRSAPIVLPPSEPSVPPPDPVDQPAKRKIVL